ncbi:MAG TPA: hypothetical protein VMR34_05805 [Candidatus Saccharimonadales bacterium]|jgi:hypothetical protein|nr:hypothetical protein [Candidatus Saccharimonadales bacterium]
MSGQLHTVVVGPMLDSTSTLLVNSSTLATSANQTNGTQQTKITDGTNVVNVLAPGTVMRIKYTSSKTDNDGYENNNYALPIRLQELILKFFWHLS